MTSHIRPEETSAGAAEEVSMMEARRKTGVCREHEAPYSATAMLYGPSEAGAVASAAVPEAEQRQGDHRTRLAANRAIRQARRALALY